MSKRANSGRSHLSFFQKLGLLAANLLLAQIPSLLFFFWVERNTTVPIEVYNFFGWPWLTFNCASDCTWLACLFDSALFFAFGLMHSALAQKRLQQWIQQAVPIQATRTVYLSITGLSLLLLMGFWQHTGRVVWAAPLSPYVASGVSLVLFVFFGAMIGQIVGKHDSREFLGLSQIFQSEAQIKQKENSPQALIQSGIYRYVRHPIYTFTFLAFLVTPVMTLDRLILTLAMALYLVFAIPVEEKKLVDRFGKAYLQYRTQVPAIIPFSFR